MDKPPETCANLAAKWEVCMVSDTAEATVETAAPESEAPPVSEEEQPESAEVEASETQAAEPAPETETTPKQEEQKPDVASLLAELDEDSLSELAPVKDLLARRSESARRKSEDETAKRLAAQKDAWVRQGQWVNDLASAYSVDEEGKVSVDTKKVNSITQDLAGVAWNSIVNTVGAVVDEGIPRDFTITREQQQRMDEATREYLKSPQDGVAPLVREWLDLVKAAAVAEAEPEIVKKARKEFEKEQATKQEADRVKAADEANAKAGQPTNVSGGASSGLNIQTAADAEQAYIDQQISHEEFKKQMKRFGIKY